MSGSKVKMDAISPHDSEMTNQLLRAAARTAGGTESLGQLLERDRDRLLKMIATRLDPRVAQRVDPADLLQEAQLEATRRFGEFLANPTMPFFLWLRLITAQTVVVAHRRHLGAKGRDARREASLDRPRLPPASSASLAARLLGRLTSPSRALLRAEARARVHQALDAMDAIDREVLTLRHFEQLSAAEAARELGITLEAAKKRHVRALRRLKAVLSAGPGTADGDVRIDR